MSDDEVLVVRRSVGDVAALEVAPRHLPEADVITTERDVLGNLMIELVSRVHGFATTDHHLSATANP